MSFVVLAQEHPLVEKKSPVQIACFGGKRLCPQSNQAHRSRTPQHRQGRTGVTGAYAVHPYTGEDIPFLSPTMLMGYGTGSIMAVPAPDQRDFDFARKYACPFRR